MNTQATFKSLLFIALQLFGISAVLAQSSVEPVSTGGNHSDEAFSHIKQIRAGVLDVEVGPIDGQAVLLIHGWPYDIYGYKEVSEQLAVKGFRVLVPYLRGYGSTTFLSQETTRNGQQ